MNQITFKQYRTIDLTIFTVLLAIFESLTTIATRNWFAAQPVAISISLAIVCIVMMRWGWRAVVPAVAGGIAFCLVSGATVGQYLIYCIGNTFALLGLLVVRGFGKETIRRSVPKLLLFGLVGYLGMVAGRFLVSLLFGGDLMAFVVYATTDIISLLFAEIILLLLRNTDGMIEDQKSYLLRVERERKEEENTVFEEEF
ncbi:MAG: hypothetical protein E7260_05885 [Lachnospiraceae bacterium]|nr:hypothetical protein [Lachnospiraceae bacterium]